MVQYDKATVEILIEKWNNVGFKLNEIANETVRRNTAILLENEHKYLISEVAASVSTDIANFNKILMPLTRRIFPNLIANEIVGVQPMAGPVGLAYAMRFYKGEDESTELGYNTVDKTYTGSHETSAGERLSSVDPTATGNMAEAKLKLTQTTVTAKTRKLKARYSLEAAQDLKNMQGVDLEAEMTNLLQYEVAQEIDREIVDRINGLADTNTVSYTVSAGDGQWEAEKFRNMYTRLTRESAAIATRTRRGAGNVIIASDNVVTALDTLGNFLLQPVDNASMELGPGVAKVGTIGNRFSVYRDTFATTSYATVGYKGPGTQNSGVIYCPYIPLMISKAVEPGNFTPVIGILTRYGVVDHLMGGSDFYSKLNIDFTGIFTEAA
jgi:hypothetical protein